jgi:hypothetical protein
MRDRGVVVISLTATPELGRARGTILVYEPTYPGGGSEGVLRWSVSTGSTTPTKFRPRT